MASCALPHKEVDVTGEVASALLVCKRPQLIPLVSNQIFLGKGVLMEQVIIHMVSGSILKLFLGTA